MEGETKVLKAILVGIRTGSEAASGVGLWIEIGAGKGAGFEMKWVPQIEEWQQLLQLPELLNNVII